MLDPRIESLASKVLELSGDIALDQKIEYLDNIVKSVAQEPGASLMDPIELRQFVASYLLEGDDGGDFWTL